ncbi:MAG TPA: FAD-dependent oxidoreductase, partial [bacterium]|nr:FAD-dependent oxidoreductase [bacterium]
VGGAYFDLCRLSFDLFPEWIERLRAEGGLDCEYLESGSLDLAYDDKDGEALAKLEKKMAAQGLAGRRLTGAQAREKEPALSPDVQSAFFLGSTRQVRPPRLTRALLAALQKQGAELRELERVKGFLVRGRAITGVETHRGLLEADAVVLATGAWTGLWGEKFKRVIPVKPVRGQVVLFQTPPGFLKHILFSPLAYLVPRRDGRLYVGSTLEEVGFDKSTTSSALERLKRGARRALPGLEDLLLEDSWAGLRPGSPDGWPFLGKFPEWEGLFIAAGHYTHGFLLSAATGRLLAQAILGETPEMDLGPFALGRRPHASVGL